MSRDPSPARKPLRTLLIAVGALLNMVCAHAQTFRADFSRWSGPPLVKDKFGVYQTPFFFKSHPPASFHMDSLLAEAGVQDLRYEMGWGKPDTYAFDQIGGTAVDLQIDWTRLDPFVAQLTRAGVTPLFAMTYDPLPLKTGSKWARWKDEPSSLPAWQQINRRYAAHYRALGLRAPRYEMWNEPDLAGDGGKVFFNGGPAEYGAVARAGLAGIHAGDVDARAGGPAIAWEAEYAQALLSSPIDFMSVHAYNNYPVQVGTIARGQARGRPDLPILLTEYASYTEFGRTGPNSRHGAAARFFRDVRGMLNYPDLTKVYWAQWIDDSLGMITDDLHRKALFNAYKLYQTLLPVDRSAVSPDSQEGVGALAASDGHSAGVVVWNENLVGKAVTLKLEHLPFAHGRVRLSRIDATHASYIDLASSENLTVEAQWDIATPDTTWTGTIPAEGVAFLHVSDGSGKSLLRSARLGKYAGEHTWFPDRSADGWADFDPHTSIARMGMGSRNAGVSQIGREIDNPARRWTVQSKRSGQFRPQGVNALFGLRLDYRSRHGGYSKSVLWHDGSYRAARTAALPWGQGKARVDEAYAEGGLITGTPFTVNVTGSAPADWDGRVVVTPILQDMGAGSQARIILRAALPLGGHAPGTRPRPIAVTRRRRKLGGHITPFLSASVTVTPST